MKAMLQTIWAAVSIAPLVALAYLMIPVEALLKRFPPKLKEEDKQ